MTKILFVIYLIGLSIGSIKAYVQECAIGPEYWCKSFQNAQDCGAIRHCTDTVWRYDNKYTLPDSSITCQWCEKILKNTYTGIQGIGDNPDLIESTLSSSCKLLSSNDLISKCTNLVENYGTSIISLMKNNRYSTLCYLMNICSQEEELPINLGQHRCTWGPSYWCSSLSNSRECNTIDHCSNKIWSEQAIQVQDNDNICKYCQYIIKTLHSFINENKVEMNIEKWLSGACSMIQTKDMANQCIQTISQYGKEILILIQNNIDSGIICHLGQMCKEPTIVQRVKINNNQTEVKEHISFDEQSKILCNVIVRATYELYIKDEKPQNEIEIFLKNDCQQLSTLELTQKCENIIDQYGNDIYGYVANNMELSKVCDYIDGFSDPNTLQSLPHTHCELCTFILSTTKYMLDNKQSEDNVLLYIDEQLCSRMNGDTKKNCKYTLETHGKDLIDNIQRGTQSMLMCTYFQVCFNEIIDKTSPIQKNEMRSFLKENICDHLGPFENSCYALMEKDTNRLLKILVNDMDGDILCQIFGICPTKMSFIDNLSINDDKNKCKRCIDDFTRRKHIAEKLVTYSSEFLHHLCGQLPQEDDCIQKVDESINKLKQFVESLNPEDICIGLKMCNETLLKDIQSNQMISSDKIINQEIMTYIKNEICDRLGSLSIFCNNLIDSEGTNLLTLIAKDIDPHQVCNIIDICPKSTAFENCNDQCECCIAKTENYQVQLAAFLQTMLTTTRVVCDHMPESKECLEFADEFKSNIDEIISNFNAKQICQFSNHCSINSFNNTCLTCIEHLQLRKDGTMQVIDRLAGYFNDICQQYPNKQCQIYIKQLHDLIEKSIEKFDIKQICNLIGFCGIDNINNERNFNQYKKYLEDELEKNICSILGPFEILCKQVIHGNIDQIQTLKINYDIKDVMQIGENLSNTEDLDECNQDKCQCCIHRIIRKKQHTKFIGDSIFFILIHSCNHSPSKQECRKHWQMAKFQFDLHIKKINPEHVCTHFGFCNKSSICNNMEGFGELCEQSIETNLEEIDNTNSTCILCEYIMNLLSNYIHQQSTQEEIEENLEKICQQIPSILKNQCNEYINNYSPLIIKLLLEEFNFSTICHKLNICTNKMKYDITYITKANISTCGICDYISTYMNFILKRSSNEKYFQYNLLTICSHLSDEQKSKCEILIHLFSPYIKELENNFCKQLPICQTPMMELQSGILLNKENQELIIDQTEKHFTETPKCTLCHYVISYLDAALKNNISEQAVEEALAKVCTILPSKERVECTAFIKSYGPVLAQLIAEVADPLTVCRYLGMCQDSSTKKSIIINNNVHVQTPYTCTICQYIINRMKYFINLKQEKDEIFVSLNNSCDLFSVPDLKKQCKDFLDKHGSYFFQMIYNDLEPRNACQSIGICDENYFKSTVTSPNPMSSSSSTTYGKCIFGMKYSCISRENAELCNAVELCERQVWSKQNIILT